MLRETIGEIEIDPAVLHPVKQGETAASPGMKYKHYAPNAVVTLVDGEEESVLRMLQLLYCQETQKGKKTCVLCFSEHTGILKNCRPHDIGPMKDASEIAHRLFQTLRSLDEEGMESVFSEVIPPEGVGLAVMNRLGRAAAFRIIHAE